MSYDTCPQCGRKTYNILTTSTLCDACQQYRNDIEENTRRSAEAAEAQAQAAYARYALEDERDRRIERQKLKQRREELAARAVEGSLGIERMFDCVDDDIESIRDKLVLMSGWSGGSLSFWHSLFSVDEHRIEHAYIKIRRAVLPQVLIVWQNRHILSPSPNLLIKGHATTILYTDIRKALEAWHQVTASEKRRDAIVQEIERIQWREREREGELTNKVWGFLEDIGNFDGPASKQRKEADKAIQKCREALSSVDKTIQMQQMTLNQLADPSLQQIIDSP